MRDGLALGALLVGAVVTRIPTLADPLVDAHAFRQTQTAYTALLYFRDGIDLLHPRVPVLGPPYQVAFEFPLFQAFATLPMTLGVPADVSLRLTALASYLLSVLFLWLLVRRFAGFDVALCATIAYLVSPLALLWSTAAIVDYLAMGMAIGFVLFGLVWRDGGGRWWWLGALVLGTGAMLVKITAAGFWVVPLLAFPARRRSWLHPCLIALVAIPIAAGLVWTRYADGLRAAGPGTAWTTAADISTFLFGTLAERVSPRPWAALSFYLAILAIGPTLIGVALRAAPAIRAGRHRMFWVAVALSPLLSIAVFFNLWYEHDYYSVAATPSAAVLVGLAAAWLWRRSDGRLLPFVVIPGAAVACIYLVHVVGLPLALAPALLILASLVVFVPLVQRRRRELRATLLAVAIAGVVTGVVATNDYWGRAYGSGGGPEDQRSLAEELDQFTRADEPVLMVGGDWSPVVLYYARREGQMLPDPLLNDDFVRGLRAAGYQTFFSWNPAIDALWPATRWPWVGMLGPHTYSLADSRDGTRGASAATTDDVASFAAAAATGRRLLDHPLEIHCGAVNSVPAGVRGTWLRLAPAGRDARIAVLSVGLGAMPARSLLVVSPELGRGTVQLGCAGTDALTILDAVDAP